MKVLWTIVILIVLFIVYKIIKSIVKDHIYFDTIFDIPATVEVEETINTIDFYDKTYKEIFTQHVKEKSAYLVFDPGYSFENKIDGKIYEFPFYKEKKYVDYFEYKNYGYHAKVLCRFLIKRNSYTGEIIEWKLFGAKTLKAGDKSIILDTKYEGMNYVYHRKWRKEGYPKGYDQREINHYDELLSPEDGIHLYREITDEENAAYEKALDASDKKLGFLCGLVDWKENLIDFLMK